MQRCFVYSNNKINQQLNKGVFMEYLIQFFLGNLIIIVLMGFINRVQSK